MRIDQVDLKIVRLPLVRPFQTSASRKDHLDHILVRVAAEGVIGWGECASPSDPYYCPETTETCWHILRDFLVPSVLAREWSTIDELVGFYGGVKGNRFARAGLEMACWDVLARAQGEPLHSLLGGTRSEIHSGVSLGIESRIQTLLDLIAVYQKEGYRRIKLKIAPGWDVDVVRHVRESYPTIALQVDANSAYTLSDLPTLTKLDEFDLVLIEQPLAHDDIIDHAQLQAALKTPICLDESIHSADDARKALDLGSSSPGDQHQGKPIGRFTRSQGESTTFVSRAACRSGAEECTNSASAVRPTSTAQVVDTVGSPSDRAARRRCPGSSARLDRDSGRRGRAGTRGKRPYQPRRSKRNTRFELARTNRGGRADEARGERRLCPNRESSP